MRGFRTFLLRNRALAALLLAATLCVRLLVPQGFMLGETSIRTLTVQLCFDGVDHRTTQIAIPFDNDGSGRDGQGAPHTAPDPHCPFAALDLGGLGAVDLPLVAAVIAFIIALGFAPVHLPSRRRRAFLEPPTRGPPLSC
jgi:hypothetical protein